MPPNVPSSSLLATLSAVYEEILRDNGDIADVEMDNIQRMSFQLIEAVKYARNRRAPINRLPDEILEIIFLLAQPYHADFIPSWPISTRWLRQMVAVTHVCKRWRDAALLCPSLWSAVNTCKSRLGDVGEDLLRRSGSAPLNVFYFTSRHPYDQLIQAPPVLETVILNHGHRITRLHICNVWPAIVYKILCRPLPFLAVLSLCDIADDDHEPDTGLSLAELTPRLRKLAVSFHIPRRLQRSVADLTHLALYHVDYVSLRDGFLDMLGRSPCLEYLLIIDPSELPAHITPASFSAHRKVSLPNLRQFYLSDVWLDSPVFYILASIDMPDDCDFRIKSCQNFDHPDLRISPLPSPTRVHLLQHISRVQVEIAVQDSEMEDERRRRGCVAVHSGTLFVTLHCGVDHLAFPSWAIPTGSDARLVLIIRARLGSESTLFTGILQQWPQLHALDIVDEGHNTAAICSALQDYKPHYAAARLGLCHELERIEWYTTGHDADRIWEMVGRRIRGGSPLREVQVRIDSVLDESGVCADETSVHRLTAGQRAGSYEMRRLPYTEWGRSTKDIIQMHCEAVLAPRLPEGNALDGDWIWDRKFSYMME
ncbi:hypothetical protein BD626DRAFT_464512 [Schizophyllum amplum]|uniref:Uncharacterized protein n=1 Tax=Schizophyllum amplum TaxID=97359 RepID=A0A550BYY5_9AGAR|nr:hypothetical protein BD626DRAFT_464512 [Auriculariopsis ampla]